MAHRIAKIAMAGALIATPIVMAAAPALADPPPPVGNNQPGHQQGPGQQQGGQQHGPQQPAPAPAPFPTGSAA